MEKNKKLYFFLIIFLLVIGIFSGWLALKEKHPSQETNIPSLTKPEIVSLPTIKNVIIPENNQSQEKISIPVETLPEAVDLLVPFTSQAPFYNWDELHNEACEEATLIMAKYFILGKNLDKETAENEILATVNWQEKNWGGHFDLSAEKIIELGKNFFDIEKITLDKEVNPQKIKNYLSQGKIIIAPCFGRNLKNPYFKTPGPVYHALVIRGYKKNNFITNDPGTKRGEKFIYSEENLLESIHDWQGEFGRYYSKEEAVNVIEQGEKVIIVIEK